MAVQLELPVVLPEAEWANPLTRGLKTALVFDNGYAFDAAKGEPRAFTNAIGTPTITSAKAMGRRALYTPNGSAANFALGEDWSGPSTLVWTSFIESVDSPWGGILSKLSTGTSTQYAAQRNIGNDYFQLSRNYSASVVNARTLSSFLGAPITFALVNESAAAASRFALYANGILVQAFNPVEAQNGGSGALLLGCESSSNATYDSSVFWDSVFRFDRALSDGEVAAIGTNPRQLLVQERRIWVPVSAGGGTTYTFSASGSVAFSGASPLTRGYILLPSGVVAFSGSSPFTVTGAISYTFSASGGVVLSGAAPLAIGRVFLPSGVVAFSGTSPFSSGSATSYTFGASGGFTLAGTSLASRGRVFDASGTVNFSGAALWEKSFSLSASGYVYFSGSAGMYYTSGLGSNTVDRLLKGYGV